MDADGCMFRSNSNSIDRRHSRVNTVYSNPIVDDDYNDYYDYSDPPQSDEYIEALDNEELGVYLNRPNKNSASYRTNSNKIKTHGYTKHKRKGDEKTINYSNFQ